MLKNSENHKNTTMPENFSEIDEFLVTYDH